MDRSSEKSKLLMNSSIEGATLPLYTPLPRSNACAGQPFISARYDADVVFNNLTCGVTCKAP